MYTKTVQICNYRPVAISMTMVYVNKNVPQCKDTILSNTNGRKTQMENTLMAPPVLGIVQNISWRIMGPVLGFVPRTKRLLKGNVSHVMGHVLKLAIFLKSYMLETSKNWKTAQSSKVSSIFSCFLYQFRGNVKTGAMGAIASVDFDDFYTLILKTFSTYYIEKFGNLAKFGLTWWQKVETFLND